jgi:hypothetical protein
MRWIVSREMVKAVRTRSNLLIFFRPVLFQEEKKREIGAGNRSFLELG